MAAGGVRDARPVPRRAVQARSRRPGVRDRGGTDGGRARRARQVGRRRARDHRSAQLATTMSPTIHGAFHLWGSTVGKKIVMALSGIVLIAFVAGHMIGNLKVYQGRETFNHYAEGLRTFGAPFLGRGQALWIVRLVLLGAVLVHIVAAAQLTVRSRKARTVSYRRYAGDMAFS